MVVIMNNQPAFPFPAYTYPNGEINHGEGGMTLRDYFAAKAMQGFCSDHKWRDKNTPEYPLLHGGGLEYATAIAAYKQADAMLKAREQK